MIAKCMKKPLALALLFFSGIMKKRPPHHTRKTFEHFSFIKPTPTLATPSARSLSSSSHCASA